MSTVQQQMLLSQIGKWAEELELLVKRYEVAVEEVEKKMDKAEREEKENEAWNLRQLEDAISSAEHIAELVSASDTRLSDVIAIIQQAVVEDVAAQDTVAMPVFNASEAAVDYTAPLPNGSIILRRRYRIVQLLHSRPRVHLYLAERLSEDAQSDMPDSRGDGERRSSTPVAIREIVLTGLNVRERKQVELAAFEEFVSPAMLGSQRLPGAGDRARIEGDRHYLVMQLRRARGEHSAVAVTLAELLLTRRQWPLWLDLEVAMEWGIQLCRIVARLHRLGVILGDLNPATILVDREGPAEWAPVLLVFWPPAPHFWPSSSDDLPTAKRYAHVFPISTRTLFSALPVSDHNENEAGSAIYRSSVDAFVAPEIINDVGTQRSDVYSLGALLYLLLTRYAPASAVLRGRAMNNGEEEVTIYTKHKSQRGNGNSPERVRYHSGSLKSSEAMELIPPHLFNSHVSGVLEQIVLRALSLDPMERFPTVFALVEALEVLDVQHIEDAVTTSPGKRRASKLGQVMEWLKQELNS